MKIPAPAGGLFLEAWIYEWGMLDELAMNAYWVGNYRESFDACQSLLANPRLPADQRGRVQANAGYARSKLAAL
jgi:hypothetical protein